MCGSVPSPFASFVAFSTVRQCEPNDRQAALKCFRNSSASACACEIIFENSPYLAIRSAAEVWPWRHPIASWRPAIPSRVFVLRLVVAGELLCQLADCGLRFRFLASLEQGYSESPRLILTWIISPTLQSF